MGRPEAVLALGNSVRLDILELLRDGPRTVGDIASHFPVSRPAISRHLRVLEEAELITHETEGRHNRYRVRPEGFKTVEAWLHRFYDDALPRFAMVANHLARMEEE